MGKRAGMDTQDEDLVRVEMLQAVGIVSGSGTVVATHASEVLDEHRAACRLHHPDFNVDHYRVSRGFQQSCGAGDLWPPAPFLRR